MSYAVSFSPEALRQIDALEDYIADSSGSTLSAERYISRLMNSCRSLGQSPYRGTAREDLGSGYRTTGFERRITILFAVIGETVTIAGIYYGGRQHEGALTL